MVDGKRPLISMKTRDWKEAQDKLLGWNTAGKITAVAGQSTLEDAKTQFLADCGARKLAEGSIRNQRSILGQFIDFAQGRRVQYVAQVDASLIEKFRITWPGERSTSLHKLRLLRTFFDYAVSHDWIETNPARKVKHIKSTEDDETEEAQPFSIEIMRALLTTMDRWGERSALPNPRLLRLRILCLVMRYSGLRISDAIRLSPGRIDGRRLTLHVTKKTKVPVSCLLPQYVVDELDRCPRLRPDHWFTSDKVRLEEQRYRRLFHQICIEVGCVQDRHSFHRFRDTFAVDHIENGTPLLDVSRMLGHTSVKTTEKHYLPWITARQTKLDQEVERVQSSDPLLRELTAAPAKLRRVK